MAAAADAAFSVIALAAVSDGVRKCISVQAVGGHEALSGCEARDVIPGLFRVPVT